MEDIIKRVKFLEDSGLLFKGVRKTIQNEVKKQKEGFLSILLCTLGANLLGNIIADKQMNRAGEGFIQELAMDPKDLQSKRNSNTAPSLN